MPAGPKPITPPTRARRRAVPRKLLTSRPVLSVCTERNNGPLIAEVAQLWIKPIDRVVDLTYGRGLYWTYFQPKSLVTNDLHTEADHHFDYRNLPSSWAQSFDVVVFDPPYTSTGSYDTSTVQDHYERYGLGKTKGWERVFADIAVGLTEATNILAPKGRLLVKCMDFVESGAIRWGRHHVVETVKTLGLRQIDEIIHFSGTGPQPLENLDGSPRRQVHSRRAHSFLLVFQKPFERRKGVTNDRD